MVATTAGVQTTPDVFEATYADARGDAARVPWADTQPQSALVNWLNAVAPSLIRCGSRVVVAGCGIGEDARELMRRGYDVTAFDCSSTAVAWARRIDPGNARCYVQADLFRPLPRWRHRHDLAVVVNTLQWISPDQHEAALRSMADLLSNHGHLLVIDEAADDSNARIDDGPPWLLSERGLCEAAEAAGLSLAQPISIFDEDGERGTGLRLRALLKRQ